jgi:hypothetical protein
VRGVADDGVDFLPLVVVQLGEVTMLRAEDLGERADVELVSVGAGGRADPHPEPVAAADGQPGRRDTGQTCCGRDEAW